jgi:hypothetical protein
VIEAFAESEFNEVFSGDYNAMLTRLIAREDFISI